MKIRIRSALAGAAALTVAAGILVGAGGAAFAAPTPGWEPDTNAIGTISFYDANGNQVTSGRVDAHPFAVYAVASKPGRQGPPVSSHADNMALLQMYTPTPGVNPGLWQSADQITGTTPYPPAGAPQNLIDMGLPIVSGSAADFSLQDFIAEFPNNLTDPAYANLYEVRMETSNAFDGVDSLEYFRTDIQVDPAAGTWSVVYPAPATATQVTVTSNPASPQPPNTPVTLTATVASVPAGSSPIPGTVQFFDGATSIGAGNYNATTGVATLALTPVPGSHHYTAKFTPTDPAAFLGATSPALTFNVGTPTSVTVSANPASPAVSDTAIDVMFTATVAPTGVAGTVTLFDGSTSLGDASYNPATGVATKTVSLNTGNHLITATLVPSGTDYAGSTSAITSYDVVASNAKPVTVNAPDATPPYTGSLSLAVANTTVTLSQADATTEAGHPFVATDPNHHRRAWVFNGNISGVSVTDTRPTQPGWALTGQASNFINGSTTVSSDNFGWTPALVGGDAEGTVAAGAAINPKFQTASSSGLTSPNTLASTAAGNGWGTENVSADLALWIPDTSPIGTYSSTLTLTLVNP